MPAECRARRVECIAVPSVTSIVFGSFRSSKFAASGSGCGGGSVAAKVDSIDINRDRQSRLSMLTDSRIANSHTNTSTNSPEGS